MFLIHVNTITDNYITTTEYLKLHPRLNRNKSMDRLNSGKLKSPDDSPAYIRVDDRIYIHRLAATTVTRRWSRKRIDWAFLIPHLNFINIRLDKEDLITYLAARYLAIHAFMLWHYFLTPLGPRKPNAIIEAMLPRQTINAWSGDSFRSKCCNAEI